MLKSGFFISLIAFYLFLLFLLFLYILIRRIIYLYNEERKKVWEHTAGQLILTMILYYKEKELPDIKFLNRIRKYLRNSLFRKFLIDRLMDSMVCFSGISSKSLQHLYIQSGLKKDSLRKLSSRNWLLITEGIKELNVMAQEDSLPLILQYTDHQNEMIRMEAQSAMVHLKAFEGLYFLDHTKHPLSEWQQIKLLHELSTIDSNKMKTRDLEKWLRSDNSSVVLFALKLIQLKHYNNLEKLGKPDSSSYLPEYQSFRIS